MNEVETLKAASEILDREGYDEASGVALGLSTRLRRPDPDEALAEALRRAMSIHLAFGGGGLWQSLSAQSRADWVEVARAARAHIAAESAKDAPAPAPESWSPTPGQWAQIKPGATRNGVPKSVDRVLVLSATDSDDEVRVGWFGETDLAGETWDYLPADSLAPVQPRVWNSVEDVPDHVMVRNRAGDFAARTVDGQIIWSEGAPFTEVLDGAL